MKYFFYEFLPLIIAVIIVCCCFLVAKKINKKIRKTVKRQKTHNHFVVNSSDFNMIQKKEELKIKNSGPDLCNKEEITDFDLRYYFS